jgi:hypothetical protein
VELTYEFTITADVKATMSFGNGPLGRRVFGEVAGGRVEGERVSGRVLPGGGDWAVIGTDRIFRLDVRLQFETDDGARVYTQYFGVLDPATEPTDRPAEFGDMHFHTALRFETGDGRYAWLTRHVFVGEGRRTASGVEYRVYRI